jgi:hypothetical protein
MGGLLERHDLSEGFRWLAAGVLFCAIGPMLFADVHPWVLLQVSVGQDKVVSWAIGLATVVVVGKAIEGIAQLQDGAYLHSRLFLDSISKGVSKKARRKAGIGWWQIFGAWFRRFISWTHISTSNIRAISPVLTEIAGDIGEASGFAGSLQINPLQSFVIFLALSQSNAEKNEIGIQTECRRALDSFLLFVTLGQAFLLIWLIGTIAYIWSIWHCNIGAMSKQGLIAAVAFLAGTIAKGASGQALGELLAYIGAMLRRFTLSVSPPTIGT